MFGIVAAAVVLVWLVRHERIPHRFARIGLALFLVAGELQRYFHDGMRWPDGLPLNLCNISTWMAVIACLTMAPWAVEFAYFLGISGAAMAILTPDLGAEWPPRFFVNHGGLIVTAAVLVFGRIVRLRPMAPFRAYAMFAGYALFAGAFDLLFQVNYAYLLRQPPSTFWDFVSSRPVFILFAGLMGIVCFWILWAVSPGRRSSGQTSGELAADCGLAETQTEP